MIDMSQGLIFLPLCFFFGYLMGSVPFGLIITRLVIGLDVRTLGSGNIGATNVARAGGKKLAAVTFLCDALKATLALALIRWTYGLSATDLAVLSVAIGSVIGHMFPIWLRFKGGKGISTFVGVLLGLNSLAAVFFGCVWISVFTLTKISSIAGLAATLSAPVFFYLTDEPEFVVPALLLSLLIFFAHRGNIRRILSGDEFQFSDKNKGSSGAK